jgi:DNA ligase-1
MDSPAKPEDVEGEGEDELDDEAEEEQEEEAASKLYVAAHQAVTIVSKYRWLITDLARASIFTKNYSSVPVADKGWKEGEP